MKILRILRRRKIKLSFIFLLLLVFIFNTYAWWSTSSETSTDSLALNVSSWEVAFVVNDEELKTEEYTFVIDEFYPGVATTEEPIEKKIEVWNVGDSSTYLNFEITEIYLYGMKILDRQLEDGTTIIETMGEESTDVATQITTANLFEYENATIFDENNTNYKIQLKDESEENAYYSFSLRYPTTFTIWYEYGLTHIEGSGSDNEVGSRSEMSIKLAWENDDDEADNIEDTRLGNLVYQFENAKDAQGNLIHEGEPALKIVTRVTATKDFDSEENTYVGEQ